MIRSKKQILFQALYDAGLLRLLIASQRHKVTILMLHGVIDPAAPSTWKPLRPQLTTKQLSDTLTVLAKYYQFISLPEATEMLAGIRPLVPNSLVLTFDDGYRNNLTFALPILRQFNAPATIFLSTGNVTEQTPLWFDRLDYAVQAMNNASISTHGIPELDEIDFSNREALTRTFLTFLRREAWAYTSDTIMRSTIANLTERLEQRSGHGLAEIIANDPFTGLLTWDEVRQTAAEIHFGSHCIDHPRLTLISPDLARQELINSQRTIEHYTGAPCTCLAYPYGSFNSKIMSLAEDCGYTSAVTTTSGLNRRKDNFFTLRRIAFPRTQSNAEILATVSGLSTYLKNFSRLVEAQLKTKRGVL